jgi:hypothetical protein
MLSHAWGSGLPGRVEGIEECSTLGLAVWSVELVEPGIGLLARHVGSDADECEPRRHLLDAFAGAIDDLAANRQSLGVIGVQELVAMAARVGVPTLILAHLIPAPGTGPVTAASFEDDVRRGGYHGQVVVAEDLHTTRLGDVNLPSAHPDVEQRLP